jgi:diguanylate cyclase (GGDEF)-like protein/PAS domain S-box-containing protein
MIYITDKIKISLTEIFSSFPVALALVGRDNKYITVNQKLADLNQRALEDHVGKSVELFSESAGLNNKRDFEIFDSGGEVPDHELILHGRYCHVSVRPLRDETGKALASMIAITDITANKMIEQELENANQLLRLYAHQDFLTEVWNRRYFDQSLENEFARSKREFTDLSLIMFDLDRFKLFNDQYGHSEGDSCLKRVALAAKKALKRPTDIICRYGGEEFAVILPNTDEKGAAKVAEEIREAIENLQIVHSANPSGVVTVSLGVAEASSISEPSNLIKAADSALYAAKDIGRNKVFTLTHNTY